MGMEQGVGTGAGHGGITCVLQTQFSSLPLLELMNCQRKFVLLYMFSTVNNIYLN